MQSAENTGDIIPVQAAEIVPTLVSPSSIQEIDSEYVPEYGKRFIPVAVLKNGRHVVSMRSMRELKFLQALTESGNLKLACEEIGITLRAGKKWMTRRGVKDYVQEQYEQKALANGLSIDKVMAKLAAAIDGVTPLDKETLEALKIVARILKPDSTSIHINASSKTVNIHGGTGDSPYAAMTKAELMRKMREVAVESGEMS